MNLKTAVCSILAVLFMISCDDETSSLGGSLTPQGDVITVKSDSCFATSRTIKTTDSLIIMTERCNLGRFTEQGSGTTIYTDYITQIGCIENFTLADSIYGIGNSVFPQWFIDTVGDQKPYYANLKLYYDYFFGDSTNSIKIDVFPLDRMIDAESRYYPDVDPSLFCNTDAKPLTSITASVWNLQEYDSIRVKRKYNHSITIPLPDSIAKKILSSYIDPDTRHYFTDSKSFMQNLVKGFYIRCSQGDGTIIYIDRTILEVNFKCIQYKDDKPKMESFMAEFIGNSEVMQMNSIKWTGLENELADNSCTWIRSPFGLMTEITIPVDEMRDDNYVLNAAKLCLSSANTPSHQYKPSVPSTLLLIRKDKLQEFFNKNSLNDNVESYIANYSTKYGTYTYENIAAMVEKMYNDRTDWLSANGKSLQNGGLKEYEQEHPDWNKVVVIPVVANLSARNSAISYNLDISMHQVKLIGGDTKIKIKTIRSRF